VVGYDHLQLRGFWTIWDNIYEHCVVITIAIIILLMDLGPYGIIFMTMCSPV
jgi:hypothetical protein